VLGRLAKHAQQYLAPRCGLLRPWPAMRSQPTCVSAWKGGMGCPGSRLESAFDSLRLPHPPALVSDESQSCCEAVEAVETLLLVCLN
jgi:hypothetical protein